MQPWAANLQRPRLNCYFFLLIQAISVLMKILLQKYITHCNKTNQDSRAKLKLSAMQSRIAHTWSIMYAFFRTTDVNLPLGQLCVAMRAKYHWPVRRTVENSKSLLLMALCWRHQVLGAEGVHTFGKQMEGGEGSLLCEFSTSWFIRQNCKGLK